MYFISILKKQHELQQQLVFNDMAYYYKYNIVQQIIIIQLYYKTILFKGA